MKPFSIGPWREERRLVEWTFDITHVTSTSVLVMKTSSPSMKPFSIGPWREERRLAEWTFDITHVTSTSVLILKNRLLLPRDILIAFKFFSYLEGAF